MRILPALCLFSLGFFGVAQGLGREQPQPVGPYFNDVFPAATPGEASGWTLENAFPNLTFVDPLCLREMPGGEFLLAGKNGQIWRFENRPDVQQNEVTEVLDLRAKTQVSGDQGLYSIALHPDFGKPGTLGKDWVFICYNQNPGLPGAGENSSYWMLSRFEWDFTTGTIVPDSEFPLIRQFDPHAWHNGGALFFDEEGFLYVCVGDGGSSDDPWRNGQKIDGGFFSGIFRIDVDNHPLRSHPIRRQPREEGFQRPAGWPASFSQGYSIPNDNPWIDSGGDVLEEFFVLGLRSPHTMHYDEATGDIWVGDVGQGSREELSRLRRGDNAQWSYREGDIAGPNPLASSAVGTPRPPVYAYPRSVGSCIIGGMRYRGDQHPSLQGKVLYGDHVQGEIYALTLDAGGNFQKTELLTTAPTGDKRGLANFFTDSAGEIFTPLVNGANQSGGTVARLVASIPAEEPPSLLSQTGAFSNLETLTPAAGWLPYGINSPLWSDNASKLRLIALPNDGSHNSPNEKITYREDGNWEFPAGTVILKHFGVATDARNPGITKRLETRFIVCLEDGGKYGVTYKWNEAGTDAKLLATGLSEPIEYFDATGESYQQIWDFPSRNDCLQCHNDASGQALGVRTHQLHRDFHYPESNRIANQLLTWNALGMFDVELDEQNIRNALRAHSLTDETAPLEHRIRSYLDSNCAHCHQPEAAFEGFDARLATPLTEQNLINAEITGRFNLPEGRYLKPGHPDLSAIHVRMENVDNEAAMPPLAKHLVDAEAVALMTEYLNGITDEEFATDEPATTARFVRLTSLSEINGGPWASAAEIQILDENGQPYPQNELTIADFSSQETAAEAAQAALAIDGLPGTFWHTQYQDGTPGHPHHLTIDLGASRPIGGLTYLKRSGSPNGTIAEWELAHSQDGETWTVASSGEWDGAQEVKEWTGLIPGRTPRAHLAGPSGTVSGPFEAVVTFDTNVTGLEPSDFEVTGGDITDIVGDGYYYRTSIQPTSEIVSVSLPASAAFADERGNSAAPQMVVVDYLDTQAPVLEFSGISPGQTVVGPFEVGLSFGEEVTGLEIEDIEVENGNILFFSRANSLVVITPTNPGLVTIRVRNDAVTDLAGNVMADGASLSVLYQSHRLAFEAEEGELFGGMKRLDDPNASKGEAIWLPDNDYPGNHESLSGDSLNHRAEYEFIIPHTGQWLLTGQVQAPNTEGDSFWVEINDNQGTGEVYLWDTAIDKNYVEDALNHRDGAFGRPGLDPVWLDLEAGPRRITIFGRDDGTKLDRLELQSERPLITLTSPTANASQTFAISVETSEPVQGLTRSDFNIQGGTARTLTGGGTIYQLAVASDGSGETSISLDADVTFDDDDHGNFPSNVLTLQTPSAYQNWATFYEIGSSENAMLNDPDNDGLENLLEYAFNLDPTKSSLAQLEENGDRGLPRMVMFKEDGEVRIGMEFLRRKSDPHLIYHCQFGSSLDDFTTCEDEPTIENIDETWERVTIFDDPAHSGAPKRFGRVMVESP